MHEEFWLLQKNENYYSFLLWKLFFNSIILFIRVIQQAKIYIFVTEYYAIEYIDREIMK